VTLLPGPCKACHQAGPNRIVADRHGRDQGRCFLDSPGPQETPDDDDVDLQVYELGREIGESLGLPLRPPVLDREVSPLHIPQVAQTPSEALERKRPPGRSFGRPA